MTSQEKEKEIVSPRSEALRLMMKGKSTDAMKILQQGNAGQFAYERLLLACALAGNRHTDKARSILDGVKIPLSKEEEAVRILAEAYLASAKGDQITAGNKLGESLDHDPDMPLTRLSLARHKLWVENDYEGARSILNGQTNFVNEWTNARLTLTAIQTRLGEFRAAYLLSIGSSQEEGRTLPVFLTTLLTWLLSTPLQGGLVLMISGFALFLPYLGPLLMVGALGLPVLTNISLRRTNPILVQLSYRILGAFALIYAIRWALLGQGLP